MGQVDQVDHVTWVDQVDQVDQVDRVDRVDCVDQLIWVKQVYRVDLRHQEVLLGLFFLIPSFERRNRKTLFWGILAFSSISFELLYDDIERVRTYGHRRIHVQQTTTLS